MIQLVIADVDGTLLTDDKRLTESAREAAGKLEKLGVAFTLVSARPPRGMLPLIASLPIHVPFGACNGAALCNPDGAALRETRIDPILAQRAFDALSAFKIAARAYTADEWLVTELMGPYEAHETRVLGYAPTKVPSFEPSLQMYLKIVGASHDTDLIARCEAHFDTVLPELTAIRSRPYFLDITARGVDKGQVVRDIAKHLGLTSDNVAVIGDMENDLPMFEAAGYSVAMANACDALLQKADQVTSRSNNDDGFADAIDLLLRRLF
jgi:Cof subfamily protein (haloacid dehalogenase superfamily)